MIFMTFFLFTFIASTLRLHFGGEKLSFIDRLLVTYSRIIYILFFIISLAFFYAFSSLAMYFGSSPDIYALSTEDISSWLSDKDNSEVKIGENANINVNAGQISVSVDTI